MLATIYGACILVFLTLLALFGFPGIYLWCRLVKKWDTRRIGQHFIWMYGRVWFLAFRPIVKFYINPQGPEKLPRPCVVVCNHLSIFDLYCLGSLPASDVSIVVKAWPFKMLWSTPFMRMASYLDIERTPPEIFQRQVAEVMARRDVLLFYPEGRRSRDGQLQRFRSGAFKIALEHKAWVVPLCLAGTEDLLPPGKKTLRPATIRIRLLDPIPSTAFEGELAHIALRKHVKKIMQAEIERMRKANKEG